MRMGNYGAMAALGITRVGDNDTGIVRQISMAGFGDLGPTGNNCDVNEYIRLKESGGSGWTEYCRCMFGTGTDEMRICLESSSGIFNEPPWNCRSKLKMAKKGVRVFSTTEAAKACADEVGADDADRKAMLRSVIQQAPGVITEAKNVGGELFGPGTGAQPAPVGSSAPNPSTGARPLPDGFFRPRPVAPIFAPPTPTPRVEPKSAMPVGLIAGVGVAAVAAFFLLKK